MSRVASAGPPLARIAILDENWTLLAEFIVGGDRAAAVVVYVDVVNKLISPSTFLAISLQCKTPSAAS